MKNKKKPNMERKELVRPLLTTPGRRSAVRRRLYTTPQPAASTSNDELSVDRGTSPINTNAEGDDSTASVATTATTGLFKYNRRTRPGYLTTIAEKLKPTSKSLSSSSTTTLTSSSTNPGEISTIADPSGGDEVATIPATASSSNDITFVTVNKLSSQKFPSGVIRRKFVRPLNANRSATTTAIGGGSTVPSDDVANADLPRTQNPLFKRRFPFSTTAATVTTIPPSTLEFNTSPLYLDTLVPEDLDQVAKSSIQETKFFHNQITDNDHSPEISSRLSSTTPIYPSTYVESITRRLGIAATTRRSSLRRPQKTTPSPEKVEVFISRRRPQKTPAPFNKIVETQTPARTYKPVIDYDYYDDGDERVVEKPSPSQVKVVLHGKGIIECLDQGNFPHPLSCRKFISCAKFETGGVVGWEYTCPKGLSYDPVGGICNWASGLGCKD